MGYAHVDDKRSPNISSVEEMVGRFLGELNAQMPQWKMQLAEDPEQFEAIEGDVHAAFARGADLVSAGLLAVVMGSEEFEESSEHVRKQYSQPLGRGRLQETKLRLLGGLVICVGALFCPPRKKVFREPNETASGVHVELVQFGVTKGVSAALQSRVARQVALSPSIELATAELKRNQVNLDKKSVRRITYQSGVQLLEHRKHQIELWRAGLMRAGTELAGCRVSIQVDGGRLKTRGPMSEKQEKAMLYDEDGLPCEDTPGRSEKPTKRTYKTYWREPKLMTIFVHDEHGRMVRKSQATIDGTLLGPDAICELIAMHLHRLGAAKALSVTFVADGAPWIWDRINKIVELAKLGDTKIYQVLDNCHAGHHVSLALGAQGHTAEDRKRLYRLYRTLLRDGQWQRIIDELTDFGERDLTLEENKELATEIAYLRKHGEAGRLNYPHFAELGLPLGSGAIESGIRRVINLRLKSNAMFWLEENAEAMLAVRASVISDRWDQQRSEIKKRVKRCAVGDWIWSPANLSHKKIEDDNATAT